MFGATLVRGIFALDLPVTLNSWLLIYCSIRTDDDPTISVVAWIDSVSRAGSNASSEVKKESDSSLILSVLDFHQMVCYSFYFGPASVSATNVFLSSDSCLESVRSSLL